MYSRQYVVTLVMISRPLTWYSCLHRWTWWRWHVRNHPSNWSAV